VHVLFSKLVFASAEHAPDNPSAVQCIGAGDECRQLDNGLAAPYLQEQPGRSTRLSRARSSPGPIGPVAADRIESVAKALFAERQPSPAGDNTAHSRAGFNG